VDELPAEISTGVYYGWASIDNGEVHKMVMSIGWNPFYDNKLKSMVSSIISMSMIFFIWVKNNEVNADNPLNFDHCYLIPQHVMITIFATLISKILFINFFS
jgi:hypothetical protein